MKYIVLLCLACLGLANANTNNVGEDSSSSDNGLWSAMKETGHYMWSGTGLQFTQYTNLYWAGLAAPSLWYSFDQDKRITSHAVRKDIKGHLTFVSNLGIVMNLPIFHMGTWYFGKKMQDAKFVQFSKEYAATLYVTLLECGAMSFIPIHERPNEDNLTFWETAFRKKSSFPSGHIVPYAALFFETFQFYGPFWSLIPLSLTVMSGQQRIQDGKHYLSDIVGAFFVAGFASEGVRAASKYQDYHPVYKWWARHDLRVSLLYFERDEHQAMGPKVTFTY